MACASARPCARAEPAPPSRIANVNVAYLITGHLPRLANRRNVGMTAFRVEPSRCSVQSRLLQNTSSSEALNFATQEVGMDSKSVTIVQQAAASGGRYDLLVSPHNPELEETVFDL